MVIQGKLFRWMLLLQEFDFKVIHRPGKRHFGADFLSRAAPEDVEDILNDQLPDASIFKISLEEDRTEMERYLQTGELPNGMDHEEEKGLGNEGQDIHMCSWDTL